MDIEFLKNLLPDVEEDALNSILSTHQQELSTLTTANAQLSQDLSAARYHRGGKTSGLWGVSAAV